MTREEAIKWLIKPTVTSTEVSPTKAKELEAYNMAIEALKDRPHGEWKNTITWQPYCSNCEYVFDEDEEYSPFWKFCPMCGAEMADNSLFNNITESPNDVVESKDDVIVVVRCKDCYKEWTGEEIGCKSFTADEWYRNNFKDGEAE